MTSTRIVSVRPARYRCIRHRNRKRIIIRVQRIVNGAIRSRRVGIKGWNIRHIRGIKIYSRCHIILSERLLDSRREHLPHQLLVLKLDFVFLWMNVYIHTIGRNFETYKIIGLHIGAYEILIACHHRLMEIRMTHIAAVDKEVLACISATCALRQAYIPRNLAYGHGCLYGYYVVLNITTEQGAYALLERLSR